MFLLHNPSRNSSTTLVAEMRSTASSFTSDNPFLDRSRPSWDQRPLVVSDGFRQHGHFRFRGLGELFARFTETDGMPDGLTMDADCVLWTALWSGSGIARLRPNGEVERRIGLSTPKTSNLTFAGQDYRDLCVTAAGGNTRNKDGELAGHCFAYGARRKECLNSVQMFVCLIDRIREEL
jgi:hypothetical protein